MKYFFLLPILFLIFSCSPEKQESLSNEKPKVFKLGMVKTIESSFLSETRTINIYTPDGYHPDSNATYPVVYVLDGSANEDYVHIVGLIQFMNMYNLLPKSIVVGIANVDRYRDFTYPSTNSEDLKSLPQSGGSEKFMDFIEKELQPLIKKDFKTSGYKTIIGQSLGGLLASEILLTRPELFDDYIIVSPSLWWGDKILVNNADSLLASQPDLEKRVFISLGQEHPIMHEVADSLVASLKRYENGNIELIYEPILTEDHATILHKAVYRGFEVLNEKEEEVD